jgi:hypothetical protein
MAKHNSPDGANEEFEMSRNYDFHVVTSSVDYWIDWADYADASECVIAEVSNEILGTLANASGCCWDCAIAASETIPNSLRGVDVLRAIANINLSACDHDEN